MLKKIIEDKRILSLYIVVIASLTLGITYALGTYSLTVNLTTALIAVDDYAYGETSFDSSDIDFKPILDTEVETNTDNVIKIDFTVGGASTNNATNIIYDIALADLEVDCNLLSPYIKWKLVNNTTSTTYTGSLDYKFDTILDGRLVLTPTQIDLPTYNAEQTDYHSYTFYMWFSDSCQNSDTTQCGSYVDQSTLIGRTFSGKVEVELYTENKKELVRQPSDTINTKTCVTPTYVVELITTDSCRNAIYNGSEQNLIKTSVLNTTGLVFSNHTATNIGSYNVAVALAKGYTWSDGTNGSIVISCPINGNIKYIGNGGTSTSYGTSLSENIAKGETYTIKDNFFVRNNYTYVGWNTAIDGTGTDYTSSIGQSFTWDRANNLTLYAQWAANSFVISYFKNGSGTTGTMTDSSHTYGVESNLTTNNYTRTGYTFKNWNTSADGTGTSYSDSQSVTNLVVRSYDKFLLYAQWEGITYTISYDGNGSDGGTMTDSIHTYGVESALTTNAYTKTDYTFSGWNTSADGTGTSYTDAQSITNLTTTNGEVITLYAQWTAITS